MAEVLTPDICVIGAGAGGLAVALAAAAHGAPVVLIERGQTCASFRVGVDDPRDGARGGIHCQAEQRVADDAVFPYPTLADTGRRAAVAYYTSSLTSPWSRRIIALLRRFG